MFFEFIFRNFILKSPLLLWLILFIIGVGVLLLLMLKNCSFRTLAHFIIGLLFDPLQFPESFPESKLDVSLELQLEQFELGL